MIDLCTKCKRKDYCFRTCFNIETCSCQLYINDFVTRTEKLVYKTMTHSLYGSNPKPIGKVNYRTINDDGISVRFNMPSNVISDLMKKEDERVSNMFYNKFGSPIMQRPEIKKVHFNPPATVVLWTDGTKTVVKCQHDEQYDPEKGLAMAIAKKTFGNKGNYFDKIKEWTEPYHKAEMEAEDAMRKMLVSAGHATNNFSALAEALKGLKPDGN